jgi:hypothetical protein
VRIAREEPDEDSTDACSETIADQQAQHGEDEPKHSAFSSVDPSSERHQLLGGFFLHAPSLAHSGKGLVRFIASDRLDQHVQDLRPRFLCWPGYRRLALFELDWLLTVAEPSDARFR